jgi:hypothetical protein
MGPSDVLLRGWHARRGGSLAQRFTVRIGAHGALQVSAKAALGLPKSRNTPERSAGGRHARALALHPEFARAAIVGAPGSFTSRDIDSFFAYLRSPDR